MTELGLSRFWQNRNNNEPILIISAERSNKTKEENIKDTLELRRSIIASGFGYIKIRGGYVETLKDGSKIDVDDEHSCIVYSDKNDEQILLKLGMILGKRYNQESILFIDTEQNAKWIYTTNFDEHKIGDIKPLGKFHYEKFGNYYSRIGKKQFSYELDESKDNVRYNSLERMHNEEFRRELFKNESIEEYYNRHNNCSKISL